MADAYTLERWEWTTSQYEQMGWHDATIHAFGYLSDTWEFVLDIDYIFDWIEPVGDDPYYQFRVAPATLIFENASNVKIALEPLGDITIQGLERGEAEPSRPGFEGPLKTWPWTLDCNEGEVSLLATGFRQVIRRAPVLTRQQGLSLGERGGLSFARDSDRALNDQGHR